MLQVIGLFEGADMGVVLHGNAAEGFTFIGPHGGTMGCSFVG